jgi:hypothetical protein
LSGVLWFLERVGVSMHRKEMEESKARVR